MRIVVDAPRRQKAFPRDRFFNLFVPPLRKPLSTYHLFQEKLKMGLISEFRAFAMRGNVVDMAVGIVIGAGFGKIVSALVEKIVMPLVGLLGGVDFSQYDITLKEAVTDSSGKVTSEAVNLGVGTFVTSIIDFVIIAFAIFLVIKLMNAAKARFEKQEEEKAAEPSNEVKLLTEIRDALKNS
jgi:large conductance mechanosensitive channel